MSSQDIDPAETPDDSAADTDEFAAEAAARAAAHSSSPAGVYDDFFSAGPDLDVLDLDEIDNRPGVLDRLGPAHFRSKEFRFMGFLQTVYNHVAEQVAGVTN